MVDCLIHEGGHESYIELWMFITIPWCSYQNSIEPNSPPDSKSSTRHEKIRMSLWHEKSLLRKWSHSCCVLELLHWTIELHSVPSLLICWLHACYQSLHVNMNSQHDGLFKKRPPHLTTHGKKPLNPLFQVSIFTLKKYNA